MKIHLRYSWVNLWGANPPPPPPYRNVLYIITYVINLKRKISQNQGGGVQPPLIYLPQIQGGLRPTPHFSAPDAGPIFIQQYYNYAHSYF